MVLKIIRIIEEKVGKSIQAGKAWEKAPAGAGKWKSC